MFIICHACIGCVIYIFILNILLYLLVQNSTIKQVLACVIMVFIFADLISISNCQNRMNITVLVTFLKCYASVRNTQVNLRGTDK